LPLASKFQAAGSRFATPLSTPRTLTISVNRNCIKAFPQVVHLKPPFEQTQMNYEITFIFLKKSPFKLHPFVE